MKSELEQLREEIAKLRERIAVLEAVSKNWPQQVPVTYPYQQPYWWQHPQFPLGTITC